MLALHHKLFNCITNYVTWTFSGLLNLLCTRVDHIDGLIGSYIRMQILFFFSAFPSEHRPRAGETKFGVWIGGQKQVIIWHWLDEF